MSLLSQLVHRDVMNGSLKIRNSIVNLDPMTDIDALDSRALVTTKSSSSGKVTAIKRKEAAKKKKGRAAKYRKNDPPKKSIKKHRDYIQDKPTPNDILVGKHGEDIAGGQTEKFREAILDFQTEYNNSPRRRGGIVQTILLRFQKCRFIQLDKDRREDEESIWFLVVDSRKKIRDAFRKNRRPIPEDKVHLFIEGEPGMDDIVCGRGGRTNHCKGRNESLWKLVLQTRIPYSQATTIQAKKKIIRELIQALPEDCRFLRKDKTTGRWFLLPPANQEEKVRNHLTDTYVPRWARDSKLSQTSNSVCSDESDEEPISSPDTSTIAATKKSDSEVAVVPTKCVQSSESSGAMEVRPAVAPQPLLSYQSNLEDLPQDSKGLGIDENTEGDIAKLIHENGSEFHLQEDFMATESFSLGSLSILQTALSRPSSLAILNSRNPSIGSILDNITESDPGMNLSSSECQLPTISKTLHSHSSDARYVMPSGEELEKSTLESYAVDSRGDFGTFEGSEQHAAERKASFLVESCSLSHLSVDDLVPV